MYCAVHNCTSVQLYGCTTVQLCTCQVPTNLTPTSFRRHLKSRYPDLGTSGEHFTTSHKRPSKSKAVSLSGLRESSESTRYYLLTVLTVHLMYSMHAIEPQASSCYLKSKEQIKARWLATPRDFTVEVFVTQMTEFLTHLGQSTPLIFGHWISNLLLLSRIDSP